MWEEIKGLELGEVGEARGEVAGKVRVNEGRVSSGSRGK